MILTAAQLEALLRNARYTHLSVQAYVEGAGDVEMSFGPGQLSFEAGHEPVVVDDPVPAVHILPAERILLRLDIRPDNQGFRSVATIQQQVNLGDTP